MSYTIPASNLQRSFLGTVRERATATLPQTASSTLFTIATGRIVVLGLVGEVTTAVQATANNTKITYTPTIGGAPVDLCAVLDITGSPVGTVWGISGIAIEAMKAGQQWMKNDLDQGLQFGPGVISLSCAASATGSAKWSLMWCPLDTNATVS